MSDLQAMGCVQRAGDLHREFESFADRQWAHGESGRKRFAFQVLHDQVVGTDVIERANVWVAKCGDGMRFASEALAELLLRDLDGNSAVEALVARFIYFAHPARADRREDLIRT